MNASGTSDVGAQKPIRLLDFWSGGWVLLIAGLLVLIIICWHVGLLLSGNARRLVGDGVHVESYGFDWTTCLVPRDRIVASNISKEGLPVLANPEYVDVAAVAKWPQERHSKLLVPKDRVLGVVINGQARAYSLDILAWHQVVNDSLAGVPILVTYDPLCDAAVVFDRRDASGGEKSFGFSGLVFNSNVLMFDHVAAGETESVWSQLQMRAIAGPAAMRGETLTVLPSAVMSWADWRTRHPDTSVLKPVDELAQYYKRTYMPYFGDDRLRFAASPTPPDEPGLRLKTPMLAILADGKWRAIAIPEIAAKGAGGTFQATIGGQALNIRHADDPSVAWVETLDGSPAPPSLMAFRFAWHALRAPESFAQQAKP